MKDEPNRSRVNAERRIIFVAGSAVSILLCGLIVLCVPKKPDLIADVARPLRVAESELLAPSSANAQSVSPAESEKAPIKGGGAQLYARFCAGCHGADGKAQTSMARMMKSVPTNFVDGPWKGPQTEDAVVEIIKNGKGAMPAYSKEIVDETELQSLAQYVLSLRGQKNQ